MRSADIVRNPSTPRVRGRDAIERRVDATTRDLEPGTTNEPTRRHSQTRKPLRRIVLYSALALVFTRFSMLHQIISHVTGANLYLLYIFGVPSLLGLLFMGGFRRTLCSRATLYWLLFATWMVLALPFSFWRGGSVGTVGTYLRTELPMLFIVAGLVATWRDCKLLFYAIAAAAVLNIVFSRVFGHVDDGRRLTMEVGTVANSNDFAAHLLLVLPFLLWVVLRGKFGILRLGALLSIGAGTYLILSTGSRGGAIALIAEVAAGFFLASPRHRIYIAAVGSLLVILATFALPEHTLQRILSFSANRSAQSQEALESEESRRYLLRTSIRYTLDHPLFGVGPGQFAVYEGAETARQGKRGNWHETHNAFTKASSECGIPALLFYLAAILSTMKLLGSIRPWNLESRSSRDISAAVFCVKLAIIGHCAAIFFLNMTYYFYLPAMTGIAIAIAHSAKAGKKKLHPAL